jgi:preprotein translocase subunit SecF
VDLQNNYMHIIRNKTIYISISVVLVVLSLISLATFGLSLGIDFTGGTALELRYSETRPRPQVVAELLSAEGFTNTVVQPVGDENITIKVRELTAVEQQKVIQIAGGNGLYPAELVGTSMIGPSVGDELKKKAIISIVLVLLAIICFIAYAFRKVSNPVSSWKYGLVAIVALLHDIIIPSGIFAFFGYRMGLQVDTLFVVALLTILAVSVSDTIVVFDRIRENLQKQKGMDFRQLVGKSIGETGQRSFNTSLASLFVLLALVFFGPASTQVFALVLALGVFFGTYSSIFLASPLVVVLGELRKKS